MTIKFEVNEIYGTRLMNNYNHISSYQVVKRTAQTIWVQPLTSHGLKSDDVFSRRVKDIGGIEVIKTEDYGVSTKMLRADNKNLDKYLPQPAIA